MPMNRLIAELRKVLKPDDVLELTIWVNEEDEEGLTFLAAIERIEDGYYLITPPQSAYLKLQDKLTLPLVIGALYGNASSPFLFYPSLVNVETIKTKGYWLSLPETMDIKTIQQRSFVRVKARVPVIIENDEETPAYTLDISGGGLQFACAKQYMAGETLSLKIRFDTEVPLDWIKARVVKCGENPLSSRLEEAYSTACQFMDLPDSAQKRIVSECFRLEVGARKHLQS
ncbi:MAG: PilZ domain-containing protein [Vampirovibrionales bacterium]|nr:PilZ domain-containing protein [Vampirovibrionales bacterium]